MEIRGAKLKHLTAQNCTEWNSVVKECQDYAECSGLLVRSVNTNGEFVTVMGPMMLLPTKFPRSVYEQALNVQAAFNELYHKVAHDYQFLRTALASSIENDEFVKRQWKIYETVHEEGSGNPVSLAILRSDYMYQLKDDKFSLCQIELNTIASSMAVLGDKVNKIHRYLGQILRDRSLIDSSRFPENDSVFAICESLVKAWQVYKQPQAVVLFIVCDEGNFADFRSLQYEMMRQNGDVRVVIRDMATVSTSLSLSEDRCLFVDEAEVAVVYFRSFFSPDHYKERDWDDRLTIERSQAIKCPSIQYQLAGYKSVQQALTLPGMVERYLSQEESRKVRDSFVKFFALTEKDDVIESALKNPDDYVLKPNREGGGNNVYGAEILERWEEIKSTSLRDTYTLMERVYPPSQYNCRVETREALSDCKCIKTVSELGIYGTLIGSAEEIMHSTSAGYLLRTKSVDVDEGGYSDGYSAIDTPSLADDSEIVTELAS